MYVFGTDHRVVLGYGLVDWNLTSWYRDLLSAIQGAGTKGKPRWIDGLSRLLLIAGGVHWIVDYRLIPACQG